MLSPLLRAMRPRQWVKNLLFVGAPVVFAQRLTDRPSVLRAAAAVAIFCVISSAVYLWNDLVDVDKDRAHPKKRQRPIASGELSLPAARAAAASFATVGLALALLLERRFAGAVVTYLLLNLAYSLRLKRIAYLDVLIIASGFLLRVLAGAFAVSVHASEWLFICTGLLACFLGFGKRAHELHGAGGRGKEQRESLTAYHPTVLKIALYATGAASLGAYFAYTMAEHTREFFHTTRMVYTVPLCAIGIGRFLMLVSGRTKAESPTEEMLRDPLFMANLALAVVAMVAIIYTAR